MNSQFPALQQRLPALLAGAFLFVLFSAWMASLLVQNDVHPDIDIVFSPPARLTPGETTEIAFYALGRDNPYPVQGLKLEAHLRTGDRSVALVPPAPAVEKRPGLYMAKLSVPETVNDGTYELAIYRTNVLRQPLAAFSIRVGTNYALAAVPPGLSLRTGGSYRFDLAAVDPATSRPLPRLPIRCRITTPDGFMTANRVSFTTRQGTGDFSFSLHPMSPAGEYLFDFSCGNRSIQFRVPVLPALPPLVFLRDLITRAVSIPSPIAGLVPGASSQSEHPANWSLHHGKEPRSTIRWAKAVGRVVRANFDLGRRRFAVIELWQGNRLLHSALCRKASGTVEITFRNRLPHTAPIKVRLWQKKRRQIWSDEYVLPSISGSDEATRRFQRLAEDCAPSQGRTLARLLTSPAVPVQVGGGLQRADRLSLIAGFLAELCLLSLPWLLLTALVLPLAGKLCTEGGLERCWSTAAFLVPVTAAMTIFFLLIRSGATEPPAPFLLFLGFLVTGLLRHDGRPIPMGASIVRRPAGAVPEDLRPASDRAIDAFVLLGQLLSGILLLHMFAGDLVVRASQNMLVTIIATAGALLTALFLAGTGSMSLTRPDHSLLASASDLLSWGTSGLAKGGWKAALLFTFLMTTLFAGILRLHTFVHPPVTGVSRQDDSRAWRQKNAQALRPNTLQFAPVEPASPRPDFAEPAPALHPSDAQRSIRSRFLILRGMRLWTGRKIQRINVFTKSREFLDRWVRALSTQRPTLWTICLELGARAERFQLLDPSERREEQERLEACLTVFGNMLARELQSGKTHSPARRKLLADTLTDLSRAISTDAAFRQAIQALPVVQLAGEDVDPAAGLIEHPAATGPLDLPSIIAPALRPGGALRLGNEDGVSLAFPVRQEMTPIVRGTSFRETFEITRLESARESPLLLELIFTP